MSEAIMGIKSEADEKLSRLPLLEKKMNKWIKIFEKSEEGHEHTGTEHAKKLHELKVNLEKLEKLSAKTSKAIA